MVNGKLIYLSHTHPDIAYVVEIVSRFMQETRTFHMNAINQILRYLKSTPRNGLLFIKNEYLRIEG